MTIFDWPLLKNNIVVIRIEVLEEFIDFNKFLKHLT